MKRVNCSKAGCQMCWKAEVIHCIFGIKRYKCSKYKKAHRKIKAKNCLEFRCGQPKNERDCRVCRRGAKRK